MPFENEVHFSWLLAVVQKASEMRSLERSAGLTWIFFSLDLAKAKSCLCKLSMASVVPRFCQLFDSCELLPWKTKSMSREGKGAERGM